MNLSSSRSFGLSALNLPRIRLSSGTTFGALIVSSLIAFEVFNFTTTDYALRDLLGELRFGGMLWATILSVAFCAIDFAGIARLFSPQPRPEESSETWFLFGAWLLAATMNAILTWWGISLAIVGHTVKSTAVIAPATLTTVVPVFIAIMVWVIRILIIGSLSLAADRLWWHNNGSRGTSSRRSLHQNMSQNIAAAAGVSQAAPRASMAHSRSQSSPRPEPTYHGVAMTAQRASNSESSRPNFH